MATEERITLVDVPTNRLELVNELGQVFGIVAAGGGRLELIFDDKGYVAGFTHFPQKKEDLRRTPIYCSCHLATSTTIAGGCVVCGRPKRPEPPTGC